MKKSIVKDVAVFLILLAAVIPYSVYWQFFRRNKKGEK